MKRLIVLLFVLLWVPVAGADEATGFDNLIWRTPDRLERVATLVLERVRSFDDRFRNAFPTPLSDDTAQITVRSTPLKDSDGVDYEINIFITVRDGTAVVTFLNIGGDLPDPAGGTLTALLLRAVIAALDAAYTRVPADL
jgi:hypothetical protein